MGLANAIKEYLARVGFPGWRSAITRYFADGALGNSFVPTTEISAANMDYGTRKYHETMKAAYDAGRHLTSDALTKQQSKLDK